MTGTIAKVFEDKGFGFIKRDDAQGDIFYHAREVFEDGFDNLKVGDKVSFEIGEGQKGPMAIDVKPA